MKVPLMFTSSGENATQTKPAKFVVFLVKDKGCPSPKLHPRRRTALFSAVKA